MTENEAINAMRTRIITSSHIAGKGINGNAFKDIEMGINALEEIKQYRAIGTVEDITDGIKQSEEEFNMLTEYLKIGTIEEIKALKEKNVAKPPLPKGTHKKIDNFCCPNCNYPLTNNHEQCQLPYCDICGQRIDWSK